MRAQQLQEQVDPVPHHSYVPTAQAGPTLDEMVQAAVISNMEAAAIATGTPTFEDEDDFEELENEPYLSDAQMTEMEADWLMEARASGEFDDQPDQAEPPQEAESLPSETTDVEQAEQ